MASRLCQCIPSSFRMSSTYYRNLSAAAGLTLTASSFSAQHASTRSSPVKRPFSSWNGFVITTDNVASKYGRRHQDSVPFDLSLSVNSRRRFSTGESSDAPEAIQNVGVSRGQGSQKVTVVKKTDAELLKELKKLIKNRKVVLFMKGSPDNPMCGFSRRAVQILTDSKCSDFTFVDVLRSERIRDLIKKHSGWPTVPQLFVGGEFVGGCDIMVELFNTGELKELLAKHGAVFEENNEEEKKEKDQDNK